MSRSGRIAKATDYFNRAPNYSAAAVADLRLLAQRDDIPRAAEIAERVASLIEAAHKFILPDNGVLFGPLSDFMFDEIRLPYETCVLEFDAVDRAPVVRPGIKCEKRLALCQMVYGPLGESVSILPIAWSSTDNLWIPTAAFFELPTVRHGDYSYIVVPFGEPGERLIKQRGADAAKELFIKDSSLEIQAVVEFSAALSCTNVTTEIIRPNREARAARPASTLFDYHILVLDPRRAHAQGEPLGGSHASPRTHLRRGHIRRHPTAGRIWVNSCVVNPTALGTVNKDYAIRNDSASVAAEALEKGDLK